MFKMYMHTQFIDALTKKGFQEICECCLKIIPTEITRSSIGYLIEFQSKRYTNILNFVKKQAHVFYAWKITTYAIKHILNNDFTEEGKRAKDVPKR